MLTNKEKQKMVEIGLKEFQVNTNLRDWMKWFVDEIDKIYDKKIDDLFNCIENPPLMPPKSKKTVILKVNSITRGKPTSTKLNCSFCPMFRRCDNTPKLKRNVNRL